MFSYRVIIPLPLHQKLQSPCIEFTDRQEAIDLYSRALRENGLPHQVIERDTCIVFEGSNQKVLLTIEECQG